MYKASISYVCVHPKYNTLQTATTHKTVLYSQNYPCTCPEFYKYFHQNFGFDGQMYSEEALFSNPLQGRSQRDMKNTSYATYWKLLTFNISEHFNITRAQLSGKFLPFYGNKKQKKHWIYLILLCDILSHFQFNSCT